MRSSRSFLLAVIWPVAAIHLSSLQGHTAPLTLACPTNYVAWRCGSTSAPVTYPLPSAAAGNCRFPTTVTCVPAPGSVFPIGTNIIQCLATNACGETASCSFQLIVRRDTNAPLIECPEDMQFTVCGTTGRVVNFPLPEVSDAGDPRPVVVCIPPSGSLFPIGTTVVKCTPTDRCLNGTECSFTVTIVPDLTPPLFFCPPNVATNTCTPDGTVVSYPKPDAYNESGVRLLPSPVQCHPPSGHVFPVGTTKVICTAKDSCGNMRSCSFNVTVIGDTTLPNVDVDGNGVGDIWQIHFNTGTLPANGDADGDGASNAEEAGAGTDPLSASSRVVIRKFAHDERDLLLEWSGVEHKLYQVQATPHLGGGWSNIGPALAGKNGSMSVEIVLGRDLETLTTNAFFRVAVSDIDEDGDGLSAWEEAILGTSDNDPGGGRGGHHTIAEQFVAANPFGPPRLREVAAAHVGGSPQGPTMPILVTAAGTAGFYRMHSWGIANNVPDLLQNTAVIEGHRIKLHPLTPPTTPDLTLNLVVNGRIHDDRNLFLSIYQIGANGAFNSLSTLGYGLNASLRIVDYAIAHRALPKGNDPVAFFQVVTPVIGTNTGNALELRVLSWTVNPNTGNLIATYATGNVGNTNLPPDGGFIQVQHLTNDMFVVSYSDKNSVLSSWFYSVNDDGVISPRGGAASGLPIRGGTNVFEAGANQFALARLNARGFSTALLDSECRMKVSVWEERIVACDAACYSWPFYMTDNGEDMEPQTLGVQLAPPVVTDSREHNSQTNDYYGSALAVGDFDGDGFADVAMGVPGEADASGVVNVMYGSAGGITGSARDQVWKQNAGGIGGIEDDDGYGSALVAGDFNNDGYVDLAVSSPREDSNDGVFDVGVVQVLYGSASGLDTLGTQTWGQGYDGLPGLAHEYDLFGEALASGDFNGDGYADLAIGIPREHVGVAIAGAVQIIYGSTFGLNVTGNQLLHQDSPSMLGVAEEDDSFGRSLAVGDFDGDGRDDLAIGVRSEDVGGVGSAGAVQVVYGTASGLGTGNNLISHDDFQPGGADVLGDPQWFAHFGESIIAGDFNGDGRGDLAVGVPGYDFVSDSLEDVGAVHIFYGGATGLSAAGQQFVTQQGFIPGGAEITGVPEAYDWFGYALAVGDFNGDGRDELIVGAPREGVVNNSVVDAGIVHVLHGSANGLTATGNQLFQAGEDELKGAAENDDFFGGALATGDFNGDGTNDLVVGAPKENPEDVNGEDVPGGGAITVIYATGSGLAGAGSEDWGQGTPRRVRALLTDMEREREYGTGEGELFVKMPAGEPISNHVASVTKVMTLLLAVEALEEVGSSFALDDDVTISGLAAGTGGSHIEPKLETNDVMKLELLLYAMMLRSCNKSSVAIAQHLTGETEGYGIFTNLMNQKAQSLGMVNTIYTHPAGGCITTPQDMVKLWSNGWLRPLFRQIATDRYYTGGLGCGVDAEGDPKCYLDVPKLGDSGYPGLEGWKGGNGGLGPKMSVPWCTSSLLGQATRLDRTLVVSLHQTGDRWGDNDRMLDYGYKLLFTPDHRGGFLTDSHTVTDFAVRSINDTMAFTALITPDNRLRVQLWQTVSGIGQVAPLGFWFITINNIPAGAHFVPTTLIDMAELPSIEAQREYISGHVEGGKLQLDLWRIDEAHDF